MIWKYTHTHTSCETNTVDHVLPWRKQHPPDWTDGLLTRMKKRDIYSLSERRHHFMCRHMTEANMVVLFRTPMFPYQHLKEPAWEREQSGYLRPCLWHLSHLSVFLPVVSPFSRFICSTSFLLLPKNGHSQLFFLFMAAFILNVVSEAVAVCRRLNLGASPQLRLVCQMKPWKCNAVGGEAVSGIIQVCLYNNTDWLVNPGPERELLHQDGSRRFKHPAAWVITKMELNRLWRLTDICFIVFSPESSRNLYGLVCLFVNSKAIIL